VGDALTPPFRHDGSPYRYGYTYAANVWLLCLVQGPFSVAKPLRSDATFTSL
jgi:hypothetical protein